MKINQLIIEEKMVEMEFTLPYFFAAKNNGLTTPALFKIVSEDVVIEVNPGNFKSISFYSMIESVKGKMARGTEITEDQFNQAYHEVLMEIGQHVPAPPVPDELMTTESLNQ